MIVHKNVRINKTIILVPVFFAAGIYLSFIFVFLSKGLGDYMTYKSHSWEETEAHFVSSEEYQRLVRRRKHTGVSRYRTIQVTRYRWQYCYEVSGGEYFYITDNHKESQPDKQSQGIMVAKDDPSLYLRYANEGSLKVMLVLGVIIAVAGGLVIVGLIIIARRILNKRAVEEK